MIILGELIIVRVSNTKSEGPQAIPTWNQKVRVK
mgnify:CR=1 FL=1